jgi:hypothetical protein
VRGNPDKIKGKGFDAHPENINRKGRPRNELFDVVLDKKMTEGLAVEILESILSQIKRGNMRAAELLLDRAFGKVLTTIKGDIETHSSDPLQIVITSDVRLTRDTEDDEPNTSTPAIPPELHGTEEVGS